MATMIESAPLNLLKRHKFPVIRVETDEANMRRVEYQVKVAKVIC